VIAARGSAETMKVRRQNRELGGGGRSIWRGDAKVTLVGVGGGRQEADGLAVSEGRASMAYELPMMMMTCCYGGA